MNTVLAECKYDLTGSDVPLATVAYIDERFSVSLCNPNHPNMNLAKLLYFKDDILTFIYIDLVYDHIFCSP